MDHCPVKSCELGCGGDGPLALAFPEHPSCFPPWPPVSQGFKYGEHPSSQPGEPELGWGDRSQAGTGESQTGMKSPSRHPSVPLSLPLRLSGSKVSGPGAKEIRPGTVSVQRLWELASLHPTLPVPLPSWGTRLAPVLGLGLRDQRGIFRAGAMQGGEEGRP